MIGLDRKINYVGAVFFPNSPPNQEVISCMTCPLFSGAGGDMKSWSPRQYHVLNDWKPLPYQSP